MADVKKPVAKAAVKQTEVKTETTTVAAPAKTAEEVKPAAKAEPVKAAAKKETKPAAKKTAAKKTTAKTATAKTTAAKTTTAVKETVNLQFSGKSYSTEELVKIAKDVWKFDLKQKEADMKNIELYVKPEESVAYYVINGEVTGSFYI